jgi:3-hydroxyisobutyrate dehydrogenase
MTQRIGFHGLGVMGLGMATRLLGAHYSVHGYDTSEARLAKFVERGGSVASMADLSDVDVVVTMLPSPAAIEETVRRYCDSVRDGRVLLFVDCSTTDIGLTKKLAQLAESHGHSFVDAPVSGGYEMAERGEISFMVGGKDEAVARAAPLFAAMGQRYLHFGPASAGQAVKACNNMVIGISMLALSEGFALAGRLGLDQRKVVDLWLHAGVQSWLLENRCPVPGLLPNVPSSKGYAPGFASALMEKDLQIAQDAATATGVEMPFGAMALEAFRGFVADGNGELDFSAIYKTYI